MTNISNPLSNASSASSFDNRRESRRVAVEKPCKLQDPRTGKYISGKTVDLSQDGILVRLSQATNLKPGDPVLLGVAMNEHQGILQAKELIESTVVRMLHTEDGATTIAVQFNAAAERVENATTQVTQVTRKAA